MKRVLRCRETGLLGGRTIVKAISYVDNFAIGVNEQTNSTLADVRRSSLPNRDEFIRCLELPLPTKAAFLRVLPDVSHAVLVDALNFWRRFSSSHLAGDLADNVGEAVAAGHKSAMEIAVEQGYLHVAKMAADQYAAIGLSSTASPNLYNQLIQCCCSTVAVNPENLSLALAVLSEMKDVGLSIDSKAWCNVVSAQAHLSQLEAAVGTLHSMKSNGHVPERELYEAVLVSVMALDDDLLKARLGEDVVREFFSDYQSLDLDGFHLLLQHVSEQNQLEEVMMQMKSAGVKMIPKTWSLVVDAVFRVSPFVSHWSKRFSIPVWPSVQWALELVTGQSEDSAVSVGSEACEKVLVACCQHSMLDRAMEVYTFMRTLCHTALSPQGYALLLRQIYLSASSRNMAPAFKIWEDLMELYDGSPPSWVYHAMMLPLAKHLRMRGVKYMRSVMISQAKKEGFFPPRAFPVIDRQFHWAWSQDMYHCLIKACATAGSPKASWQYYKEMQAYWKPDRDTFANLLLIVKRKEQLKRHGLFLFSEMISKQIEVQMLRHPLLLMCGRIQSKEDPTARPIRDGLGRLLDSTGILPLANYLVADLGETSVSVRGVLCSSIVNVLLQFVQEEVKGSTVADVVDWENGSKEGRFEATDCFDNIVQYEACSSIDNCCAKLRNLSKQFAIE